MELITSMDIVVRVGVLARESDRSEVVRDRLSRINRLRSQVPRRFGDSFVLCLFFVVQRVGFENSQKDRTLIGNGDHVVGIVG